MSANLYELRRTKLPPLILAGYFTLFGVIYFIGFDAAPSTDYNWRFFIFFISVSAAVISMNQWRRYWLSIGCAILFLILVEFVITMTATYDFFNTPGNVGLGTLLSWRQDPRPFYIVGFKIRAVWFFLHILALWVWYWGKPSHDKDKSGEARDPNKKATRRWPIFSSDFVL